MRSIDPVFRLGARWFALLSLPAILIASGVVRYGIGLHPEWRRFHDAANAWPQVWTAPLMLEGDRSLLSNVSAAWIAGTLSLGSVRWYLVFQIGLTFLALAMPFLMPQVRASISQSRLLFLFVAGGPVTAILLSWSAGYDAILVLALTIAVLSRRRPVTFVAWFALGFSHTAVAVAMVLLWLPIAWLAEQRGSGERWLRPVVGVTGVLLGGIVIRILTDIWGGSTDRIALFRSIPYEVIWNANWAAFPLIVFSVLGIGWFVVFSPALRSSVIGRVLIVEAVIAAVVLPLVALDQTRIAGLAVLAPVLAFVAAAPAWFSEEDVARLWHRLKWIAALVPVLVIWQGAVLYAGMPATRAVVELITSP